MNKGARGVIGTECRMPAQFAAQWADAFFDALLAGQPLGETVLALRRGFLSEHGNPLGLLYGLHCNADTQVAPQAPLPPRRTPQGTGKARQAPANKTGNPT